MAAHPDQTALAAIGSSKPSKPCVLGVIIAREGSKRLPGKNIRPLGGKPLIAWTIEVARSAASLTDAIVSTDSPEIARIAEQWGGRVPFLRPGELAEDDSSAVDVLRHAAGFMDGQGTRADFVVLLQATSPFRTASDVDAAVELLISSGADTLTAVRPASEHPYWAWTETNGQLAPFFSMKHMEMPRRTMPAAYIETGALYVVCREVLDRGTLYGERIVAYQTSARAAVDIDDAEDFQLAERLLGEKQSGFGA